MNKFLPKKEDLPYWLGAIIGLFIICFALMLFTEAQVPSTLTSSGIVAIISAVIGVLLTVFVTSIMLKRQSDTEAQKDKDVEIYKEKIAIFSKITGDLWKMIDDVNNAENTKIASEKAEEFFKKFKTMCFNELIFYLNQGEIKDLTETIKKIDINNLSAKNEIDNIGKITYILQNSLENKGEDTAPQLKALYILFDDKLGEINREDQKLQEQAITVNNEVVEDASNITFWHFNMWDDAQIEAFKRNNWILSLFECEEEWRSNLLTQVNKDDVIFLFRRGGYGYVGAFRAESTKKFSKNDLLENKDYDIYNAFDEQQATVVAGIKVRPIAYNYEGVGYLTVRRRTIERMYDEEAIKFLLNRFNGNGFEEDEKYRLDKKGWLDNEKELKDIDSEYFFKVLTEFKLR